MQNDAGADRDRLEGAHLGRYELVRRIAYGGMAEIFLAHDTGVQGVTRKVVVKRILPNITEDRAFVEMFLDEARIAARLSHQNIAHVYDFGESEGRYYIAMEYVDGLSLSALLNACRPDPLPLEHAVRIGSLLAQALYYAHNVRSETGDRIGVVHRDVSPQNVLLSYDGQVKLVDFGIAKAADQVHHTEAGVLKGKYAYMAPEQCVGHPYDHRVDIFSLGTLLHESLTGTRLFKRENAFQTMSAVTAEPIPTPSEKRPGLPVALDTIVMRALARKVEDRYPSADELALDLEQLLQDQRLISNQILLGRFIASTVERSDELARGGPEAHSGTGSASSSAPSWSGARPVGERVSQSDISRLRRVVEAGGAAPDADAAAAARSLTAEPPGGQEGVSEAEGDTQQHDVSFLADEGAPWGGEAEMAPPGRAQDLQPPTAFKVPAPPSPAGRGPAAPTQPEIPALIGDEEEEDDDGVTTTEPGPDKKITERVPTLPGDHVPTKPAEEERRDAPAAATLDPKLLAPTADGRPPPAPYDLTVEGDDDAPTAVVAPPAAALGYPEEAPQTIETAAPPLGAPDVTEETPAAQASTMGLEGAEQGDEPGPAVFAEDPSAEPSEVVLPSRFPTGIKTLLLIGAVTAVMAFVVVAAILGLQSVVRDPDPTPTPSTPVAGGEPAEPTSEVPGPGSPPIEPNTPTAPAEPAAGSTDPAASPPAAAPLAATLVVDLERGDTLSIDDAEADAEVARGGLAVEPGPHRIRVRRPGDGQWTKRVDLEPGSTTRLRPHFAPAKTQPGRLFVNSRPWSHAYVDGRKVGTTPIVGLSVPAGRRSIKLVAADGREKRRNVRIRPGQTAKVFVQF